MKVWTQTSVSKSCRGFTLLEVLLVCALLALAATVTTSFLSGSDQKEFTVNLGQVSALLRYSRRQAIISGAEHVVRLATVVAEDDRSDSPAPSQPDWLNEGLQLRYAATLDDDLEEVPELEMMFFPTGSSTGGLIELADGDERSSFLYVAPLTGKLMVESRLEDLEDRLLEYEP